MSDAAQPSMQSSADEDMPITTIHKGKSEYFAVKASIVLGIASTLLGAGSTLAIRKYNDNDQRIAAVESRAASIESAQRDQARDISELKTAMNEVNDTVRETHADVRQLRDWLRPTTRP